MNTYDASICFKMPDGSVLAVPARFDSQEKPADIHFVSWMISGSSGLPQVWTPPAGRGQAPVGGRSAPLTVRCPDCAGERSFGEVAALVDSRDELSMITMPDCRCRVRVVSARSKLEQAEQAAA